MSSFVLQNGGAQNIAVPATARAAFYSDANYQVFQVFTFANQPESKALLFQGRGAFTTAAFASGATLMVQVTGAAASDFLWYSVGTDAVVIERIQVFQGVPGALNATGALTAALIMGGTVTSTTAAAVTATLPTGAVLDAANTFAIGDVFFWSAIATGANAFTVTAATNHTIVGTAAVATVTSGRFMTRKTAANTFVTYRVA